VLRPLSRERRSASEKGAGLVGQGEGVDEGAGAIANRGVLKPFSISLRPTAGTREASEFKIPHQTPPSVDGLGEYNTDNNLGHRRSPAGGYPLFRMAIINRGRTLASPSSRRPLEQQDVFAACALAEPPPKHRSGPAAATA
jgi:hypothetical protein